jgi:RNA polymerase sigma factor (sigma-70 family)
MLVCAARQGDRRARDEVVRRNLGFVRGVASRYRDLGLPFEDLVQEGVVGLLEAIETYEPRRDTALSTYAFWHVRRAITHALTNEARLVRLPRRVVERRRAALRAWSRLAGANGHTPTNGEIAAATGLSVAAVDELQTLPAAVLNFDEPRSESGLTMADVLADTSAADPELEAITHERGRELVQAIQALSPRERVVIASHFGLGGPPRSLQDVAEELHLSAQRAREIEQEALHELDAALRRPNTDDSRAPARSGVLEEVDRHDRDHRQPRR